MRVLLALVLAVALFAAGCLSSGDSPSRPSGAAAFDPLVPPVPDYDFTQVVDPDHQAHELAELHTAGHGLDLVGFAPIQDILPVGVRGSITQIDIWGDYAVVSGMEGGLGFAIVDISDRAHPKAVSFYPSTADGWSARFSGDGNYVFYGCQTLGPLGYPTTNVQGTCEDPTALHAPGGEGNGVVAVDVTDKAHPKFAAYLALNGSHNLFTATIHGEDYVFTEVTEIVHFDRAAKKLEKVSEVPGVHDATVAQHPLTGQWLLSTGAAGGKFSIYGIDDPADPVVLCDACLDGVDGWHEQTFVPGMVDGRFLLILAGEDFCGTTLPVSTPGCGSSSERLPDLVSVVDVTRPDTPNLLGTWSPPIKPSVWISYAFSAHEMAATPTGQVAMGWYHGGVWVFDVSTQARQASPVTLAAYQPHEPMTAMPPAMFAQVPLPFIPFVWGAGWTTDGYLVVPDMHTGVYVLEPEWGLHPALDSGQ